MDTQLLARGADEITWHGSSAIAELVMPRPGGLGTRVLLVEFVIPTHNREFLGKWADLEMLVCASAHERTATQYS